MEADERLVYINEAKASIWAEKVNQAIKNGQFCDWASSCHPQKLPCETDKNPTFRNGAYNLGQRVIFSNGDEWLIRLAQTGPVHDEYADEKVAIEVEALRLIYKRTDIPVPVVHCWGLAKTNRLGLGPFIMMEFIQGVSLLDILRGEDGRMISDDISDSTMEQVYRQMAWVQLQLSQVDFDTFGSLPTPVTGFAAPPRPLTIKAHDILHQGGVNTFGDRSLGFSNATEFFQAAFMQDWEQLVHQPNSAAGRFNAERRFLAFNAVMKLLPSFIHPSYLLECPKAYFRSRDDLTFVGAVDLEWSFAGPAQLAATPWWLLQARLSIYDIKFDKEGPAILERFNRYLDLYLRVLKEEEEEAKIPGDKSHSLSSLVEWSRESGALWFNMMTMNGFNCPSSLPFSQLINHVGDEKFKQASQEFADTPEIKALVETKVAQIDAYRRAEDRLEALKEKMEAGELERTDFITEVAKLC